MDFFFFGQLYVSKKLRFLFEHWFLSCVYDISIFLRTKELYFRLQHFALCPIPCLSLHPISSHILPLRLPLKCFCLTFAPLTSIIFFLPTIWFSYSFTLHRESQIQQKLIHGTLPYVWSCNDWYISQGIPEKQNHGKIIYIYFLFIIRYYLTWLWRLRSPTNCYLKAGDPGGLMV